MDVGARGEATITNQNHGIGKRILVAEPLGQEGLSILRERAEVDVRLHLSPAEIQSLIPDYHALIVRSGIKVNAALLEVGRNLVVVGRAGVGVDNIDVEAATRCGITVVNAPTTNIVAAAEQAVALMFALARKIPQADRSVRSHEWKREQFVGVELVGKRLGLVGLGRVGSEVARRAVGLGMQVVAFDPYVSNERAAQLQVRMVSFEELLASCDFISLHAPMTRETKRLMGVREFEMVKTGAHLINAARGALIDEAALLDALNIGKLAGAGLDVFDHEPPDNVPLLQHERVVLTPHIGGSTQEASVRVSLEIAGEVLAVLETGTARFAVNAPLIPPSLAPQLPPFIDLAERLGRFYVQWVGGPLDAVEIEYDGALAAEETGVLTAAVIKGLLEPIHEMRVNLINAHWVAQSHGLIISERKARGMVFHESVIGIRGTRRVKGTIVEKQPHIIQLDDYSVDFCPQGHLLLIRHRDRPGMIGRVGTTLGNADVNIASMQVARDAPRGEAIMVLTLDDPVPDTVFEMLRQAPDIEWAKVLQV